MDPVRRSLQFRVLFFRPVLLMILIAGLPIRPALLFAQGPSQQTETPVGTLIIPPSSVEHPGDIGVRAHTNHLILARPQKPTGGTAPVGETPGSIACVYETSGANPGSSNGCPITGKIGSGNNGLPTAGGGSGVIAIVDAYDYPSAENDFAVFSNQFGLPCSSGGIPSTTNCSDQFSKVYAAGTQPSANCGWAQEAALDIEWAHSMSPGARIVLVEAASNSLLDLLSAVSFASGVVTQNNGKGEVSMSWGTSEFLLESSYDHYFTTPNVVYFAASGDSGGQTIWPGVSPNVVCAGGTTINRNTSGQFTSETAWSGSGGGPSTYELRPVYQDPIAGTVGSFRGVPDLSGDANPNTGVWVYDSTPCNGLSGWLIFGGTSVSTPSLAGIVNLAGSFYSSSPAELQPIYAICTNGASSCSSANFRDITSGRAGRFHAQIGWDFVTGIGSNLDLAGK